jgi:hypothetical protein
MFLLFFFLCILFSILFTPFDFTISPERKFKVVGENGVPIPGSQVKQVWYQYSLGYRKEEIVLTDSEGFALLRRRGIKTRWIDLLTGALGKIVEYKIHASIGSADSVIINAFGYEAKWFFDGEGLGETVVLKRQ